MTAPEEPDPQLLIAEIARFESLDELDAGQFRAYAEAETTLENLLLGHSAALTANCEHHEAVGLLDQVLELNRTLRRIAERERLRINDDDCEESRDLAQWRDLADGLILIVEGARLINLAEARRLASDLDGAAQLMRESLEYYGALADSELPQAGVGELRRRIGLAHLTLYSAIAESRIGSYRGAHDALDEVRVVYEELLADAHEIEEPEEPFRTILAEVVRELTSALVDVTTLGAVNDMLQAAQDGRFLEVIDNGRAAVQSFETSILAARAAGPNRNMVALRQMELEYVRGWVHLAGAETAMDRADWDAAVSGIRTAREHWATMSRLGLRNLHVGVLAQRPDSTSHDFLLQGAMRRLERDRRLRAEIDDLRESLHRSQLSNIQVIASANAAAENRRETTMGDTNHFNGPVNVAGALGSHNRVGPVHQVQHQPQAAGTDLRVLARQLEDLAEVLGAGPRSPRELESVELVRQATAAAKRGDEAGVRGFLAGAGRWILDVAEKVGLEVAVAVMRQSLGA
ncbi:hypothetical protein AB0M46_16760 [Dactylosporangium sp. NPDC051485]|uniref:hypothetical protein n=1 Tax=Dactylosporangium sp. NPDC051485 TaxID=3154846 RepID=UPI00343FCCBA